MLRDIGKRDEKKERKKKGKRKVNLHGVKVDARDGRIEERDMLPRLGAPDLMAVVAQIADGEVVKVRATDIPAPSHLYRNDVGD